MKSTLTISSFLFEFGYVTLFVLSQSVLNQLFAQLLGDGQIPLKNNLERAEKTQLDMLIHEYIDVFVLALAWYLNTQSVSMCEIVRQLNI